MEKYILDLLLRYRDHALIKDVLVDINESKLLEALFLQRLFSPSRYNKSVILNAVTYDVSTATTLEKMCQDLRYQDLEIDGTVSLPKLYNVVSFFLRSTTLNRFGLNFTPSQYHSVFSGFLKSCEWRIPLSSSSLSVKSMNLSAYFFDHRNDKLLSFMNCDSSQTYAIQTHDFSASDSHLFSKLESALPDDFFVHTDILVHIILLRYNNFDERILQNAISLVSLTLESCHASLSSVDCSMSAEVIDSMFSLIMSSAMTESLPGHEHVNIKSDPFDYLTYIRFSIASTLRRLKILMIIPLVQNSNTEECASTSVLIAKIFRKILYFSWILFLDLIYPVKLTTDNFSRIAGCCIEPKVNQIVFEMDYSSSVLHNFLVYLKSSGGCIEELFRKDLSATKTSSILTFLACTGQTSSYLKGNSITKSEDDLVENVVLRTLQEIHAESMASCVHVTQAVQYYTVFSDFDFETTIKRIFSHLSNFLDERFRTLNVESPCSKFSSQTVANFTSVETRRKISHHLLSWKQATSHADTSIACKYAIESMSTFLQSALATGYMIPSVLSPLIDTLSIDEIINSHRVVLYRIYELRTWEIVSDVLLSTRTVFPSTSFSRLTIWCLQQFENSLSSFESEYLVGPNSYFNELLVATMSNIFELAIKSYSFEVARQYLFKFADKSLNVTTFPTPFWKSCVREYIRECTRFGTTSELVDFNFPDESSLHLFIRELEIVACFGVDIKESMEANNFESICSLFLRPAVRSRFPRIGWTVLSKYFNSRRLHVDVGILRLSMLVYNALKVMHDDLRFSAADFCGMAEVDSVWNQSVSFLSVSDLQLFNQIVLLSLELRSNWCDGIDTLTSAGAMGYTSEILSVLSTFRRFYAIENPVYIPNSLMRRSLGSLIFEEIIEKIIQSVLSTVNSDIDYISQHCSYCISPEFLIFDLISCCDEQLSMLLTKSYFRIQVCKRQGNQVTKSIAWGLFLLNFNCRNDYSHARNCLTPLLLQANSSRVNHCILKFSDVFPTAAKLYGLSTFAADHYLLVNKERVKEFENWLAKHYRDILFSEISDLSM